MSDSKSDTRLGGPGAVSRRLYARLVTQPGAATVVPLDRPAHAVDASPAVEVPLPPLELPGARRPGWPTLAALAIATGLVAIGLGVWAVLSDVRSEPSTSLEGARLDRALAILTDSHAERRVLRGSAGRIVLVVAADDSAALALDGLGAAGTGREYAAWLVPPGSATPARVATFDGSVRAVLLSRPVQPGARVGVTVEAAGGGDRPTRPLRLVALRD